MMKMMSINLALEDEFVYRVSKKSYFPKKQLWLWRENRLSCEASTTNCEKDSLSEQMVLLPEP